MDEHKLLELLDILVDEIPTPYFKCKARVLLVEMVTEYNKEKESRKDK